VSSRSEDVFGKALRHMEEPVQHLRRDGGRRRVAGQRHVGVRQHLHREPGHGGGVRVQRRAPAGREEGGGEGGGGRGQRAGHHRRAQRAEGGAGRQVAPHRAQLRHVPRQVPPAGGRRGRRRQGRHGRRHAHGHRAQGRRRFREADGGSEGRRGWHLLIGAEAALLLLAVDG
jgi:hypothetical protein